MTFIDESNVLEIRDQTLNQTLTFLMNENKEELVLLILIVLNNRIGTYQSVHVYF